MGRRRITDHPFRSFLFFVIGVRPENGHRDHAFE